MALGFVDKVKGFLLNPAETFRQVRDESMEPAFVYFVILVIVDALMTALVALFGVGTVPMMSGGTPAGWSASLLVSFVGAVIGGIILLVVGGLVVHLFVVVFGGRRGVMQTFKAIIYGATPGLLLGWIPILGFFAGIYSIVLCVIGIRELQDMSTARAALAVIAPVVIAVVLIVLVAAALFIAYAEVTELVPGMTP